jgi:hypothetical protein
MALSSLTALLALAQRLWSSKSLESRFRLSFTWNTTKSRLMSIDTTMIVNTTPNCRKMAKSNTFFIQRLKSWKTTNNYSWTQTAVSVRKVLSNASVLIHLYVHCLSLTVVHVCLFSFRSFFTHISAIDLVVGGPPCIDYTRVNARRKGAHGEQGSYMIRFGMFIRTLERLQRHDMPHCKLFFLVENVVLFGDDLEQVCNAFGLEWDPIELDAQCKRSCQYYLKVYLNNRKHSSHFQFPLQMSRRTNTTGVAVFSTNHCYARPRADFICLLLFLFLPCSTRRRRHFLTNIPLELDDFDFDGTLSHVTPTSCLEEGYVMSVCGL